ncbi:hypothetical protein ORJ04_02050 [Rheinheimera baltica]|uniref:Uncharacterized protein n=1 Tax=Rheinheimera baltica TaxID=67576 RepID=A0ABT9HVL6_9GAMM|nr:hypothetical protein [Rheinheimera baltica]MDP5134731.1 hypothetical protein [Rheinheimera baltica]
MEKVFKATAIKAPVVTAVFVALIYILSLILGKEIPVWLLAIIALLTFLLSTATIYFNYKNSGTSTTISDTEVSNVETGGGSFTIGDKNTADSPVILQRTKINKVSTGGGEFVVGKKSD